MLAVRYVIHMHIHIDIDIDIDMHMHMHNAYICISISISISISNTQHMCVCVVYTFVVCAFSPFLEHRNSAKNEEQFSGSFVFGPLKLLTRVRQFVSSFKSSLEEV